MFLLDAVPAHAYTDPWNISLSDRLRILATGKKRVAYFYEQADYGTFRYRAYNMAQVLNETEQEFSASYFFLSDLHQLNEIANLADILVICRVRYSVAVNHLITTFRNRNKKVLFDVDDLVFDVDWAHLLISTLDEPPHDLQVLDFWFAYISRMGATLKRCDGAITTNAFLAEQLKNFAKLPTAVVSNFLNREQLEISERIFASKINLKPGQDGFVHVGYFSGTGSHNRDFALVIPSLELLLEEFPFLCVVVVGYIQADCLRKRFGEHRVKHFPFCDFINLQRLIGSVEFNLVPLQYNVFTNCKSELKYFEAAIVGTQTIASPTFTYAHAIRHQDNGYLSQAHLWGHTIRQALNEMNDYQKMAARSREDAQTRYACFNQKQTILKALDSLNAAAFASFSDKIIGITFGQSMPIVSSFQQILQSCSLL